MSDTRFNNENEKTRMVTDSKLTDRRRSKVVLILAVPAVLFFVVSLAALGAVVATLIPVVPSPSAAVSVLSVPGDGGTAPAPSAFYLELAGVVGSLALSLALAAIYVGQNDVLRRHEMILDEQTTIQHEQTRIAARRGHPLLAPHSEGVSLVGGDPTLETFSDGTIGITTDDDDTPRVCAAVENHGDVVAQQLQVVCLVDYAVTDGVPDLPDEVFPGIADVSVNGVATEPPSGEGGVLPPTGDLRLLVASPQFSAEPGHDGGFRRFLGAIESHLADGEAQLRFGFVLVYTNAVGSPFKTVLEPGYAVDPTQYDPETDDLTLDRLRCLATAYDTADLVEDLDWEIPASVFREQ